MGDKTLLGGFQHGAGAPDDLMDLLEYHFHFLLTSNLRTDIKTSAMLGLLKLERHQMCLPYLSHVHLTSGRLEKGEQVSKRGWLRWLEKSHLLKRRHH